MRRAPCLAKDSVFKAFRSVPQPRHGADDPSRTAHSGKKYQQFYQAHGVKNLFLQGGTISERHPSAARQYGSYHSFRFLDPQAFTCGARNALRRELDSVLERISRSDASPG
jgi:hypothetical protein